MSRLLPLNSSYGMSSQQIADQMGISRQAVDMIIARALRKLQRQMIARGWRADDVTIGGGGDGPAALMAQLGVTRSPATKEKQ